MDGNYSGEYDFVELKGKLNNEFSHLDSRGGICEQPDKDIYQGQRVIKTLNTGMITVINHNTRTSSLMTELAFTHEVGHNLGAEVFALLFSILFSMLIRLFS